MTREWVIAGAMRSAQQSAFHLEMRDLYMVDEADLNSWRTGTYNGANRSSWWLTLAAETVARGVSVRRARIVSEPVSEYIRFEYESTTANIRAGEDVRWLSRRVASDIAVPVNDFWLIDGKLAIFNQMDGYGNWVKDGPEEVREEPEVVQLCAAAFTGVWDRAIPHADYRLI